MQYLETRYYAQDLNWTLDKIPDIKVSSQNFKKIMN